MAENIKRYFKYAKDLEVEPPSRNMEDRIIYEVSHIKNKDKVLDDNFLRFLRENNSRYFLIKENIRNHPGKSLLLVGLMIIVSAFLISLVRAISTSHEKAILPSSKNKTQD